MKRFIIPEMTFNVHWRSSPMSSWTFHQRPKSRLHLFSDKTSWNDQCHWRWHNSTG